MRSDVRELISYASSIGFVLEGKDGRGHYKVRYKNGETYPIPATPSDHRSLKNARADLRKIAGVSSDAPRAASYSRAQLGSGFSMTAARRDAERTAAHAPQPFEIERRERHAALRLDLQEIRDEAWKQICALKTSIRRWGAFPEMQRLLEHWDDQFDYAITEAEANDIDLGPLP